MITIQARINITGNSSGTITSASNSLNGNNVSSDLTAVVNKKETPLGTPFILGRSILGKGDTYTKQLPYYMGAQLANSAGNFTNKYTITINGTDISSAVIVFDKENERYPKSLLVDGEIYVDDDPQIEIHFPNTSNSHTIEISNWNTPNEPLIITGIYADLNIDIGLNNLISFNSTIQDRDSSDYPTYGLISNTATLNFADLDEQTKDLITQKILHSGITVTVDLVNDTANNREQICKMEIRNLSYDNNNRSVSLSLKDNLEDLQSINFEGISYTPTVSKPKTAKDIYNILYGATANLNKYDWQSYEDLDQDVKDRLNSITIRYPAMESSNLWDSWNKLCQLCLLHIYIDNDNKVMVKCD